MKIFRIAIVILALLLVCQVYFLLYTPWLISKNLPSIAERYFPGMELKSYRISRQSFFMPGTLTLKGVDLDLGYKGSSYQVRIEEAVFEDIFARWQNERKVHGRFSGVTLQSGVFRADTVNITAVFLCGESSLKSAEGLARAQELSFHSCRFRNVDAKFKTVQQGLAFSEVRADGFGGAFQGEGTLARDSYGADFKFQGLKPESLQDLNPGIFRNLSGIISGVVKVSGTSAGLSLVAAQANLARGGVIKAGLLKRLVSYVTRPEVLVALEDMAEAGTDLTVRNADVHVLSARKDLLGVTFVIEDQAHGLSFRETVNVDTDRLLKLTAPPPH